MLRVFFFRYRGSSMLMERLLKMWSVPHTITPVGRSSEPVRWAISSTIIWLSEMVGIGYGMQADYHGKHDPEQCPYKHYTTAIFTSWNASLSLRIPWAELPADGSWIFIGRIVTKEEIWKYDLDLWRSLGNRWPPDMASSVWRLKTAWSMLLSNHQGHGSQKTWYSHQIP